MTGGTLVDRGAISELDHIRLRMAQQAAEGAIGVSEPNPRVGCVIGTATGELLGTGSTQRAGEAHAEVMALRQAAQAGASVRGATAWVTLEPCSHHGRTPPCCDALIQSGVARVVVAERDPNPRVAGRGLERLRAAGTTVEVAGGEHAQATRELNIGFFSRHERGRPWVRMKVAASLDGRTALPDGRSQWITGEAARIDGHRWRQRAGAIVTGIGTVLADDPRLDVRLVPTSVQPLRVVVDSHLRMPPSARIAAPPGPVWLATARRPDATEVARWRDAGVAIHVLADERGRVDLQALVAALTEADVNEAHIEAGAVLNGALLQAGLVDELLLYLAPVLIGRGRSLAELGTLENLSAATRFQTVQVAQLGDDSCLRLRPATGSRGLPGRREP